MTQLKSQLDQMERAASQASALRQRVAATAAIVGAVSDAATLRGEAAGADGEVGAVPAARVGLDGVVVGEGGGVIDGREQLLMTPSTIRATGGVLVSQARDPYLQSTHHHQQQQQQPQPLSRLQLHPGGAVVKTYGPLAPAPPPRLAQPQAGSFPAAAAATPRRAASADGGAGVRAAASSASPTPPPVEEAAAELEQAVEAMAAESEALHALSESVAPVQVVVRVEEPLPHLPPDVVARLQAAGAGAEAAAAALREMEGLEATREELERRVSVSVGLLLA